MGFPCEMIYGGFSMIYGEFSGFSKPKMADVWSRSETGDVNFGWRFEMT
jgi:hypothetical protein